MPTDTVTTPDAIDVPSPAGGGDLLLLPQLRLDPSVWEPVGDADPSSRLRARILLGDIALRLEARALDLLPGTSKPGETAGVDSGNPLLQRIKLFGRRYLVEAYGA